MINPKLDELHIALKEHSMYKKIKNFDDLKVFMESHVFAVWDFMSLLKRLQQDLTCVQVPWVPAKNSKQVVRLINSIVLGEESDIGLDGKPIDHFTMYLNAMDEVGASYGTLMNFVETQNYDLLTPAQRNFVGYNLNLAKTGSTHEVASAFFFGREKLIPDMFTSLLHDLKTNIADAHKYKNLIYYLERHIEIDGGEHSHQAEECLNDLCGNNQNYWSQAYQSGIISLQNRIELWNEVESRL